MMKFLVAIIAALALSAATAEAANAPLYYWHNVTCHGSGDNVACIVTYPEDGDVARYAVSISPNYVFIYDTELHKRVATRRQP